MSPLIDEQGDVTPLGFALATGWCYLVLVAFPFIVLQELTTGGTRVHRR